jgi:hypothetical protein
MKNFEQFINENLRFEDSVKLENDITVLLEMYQEYYDNIETAKAATYDPETLETLNSILDGLDQAIMGMKKLK